MCPGIELAPESGTEELRDDAHVLLRKTEHLRQHTAHVDDSLRRVVQRQHLALPDCGSGVQFEWIVRFSRRAVGFIQLDRRAGKRGFGITAVALQSWHWSIAGEDDIRIVARFEARLNIWFFFRVGRTDSVSRSLGRFESVSHNESDVLAVVTDYVVFKWWPPLQTNAIEAWGRSGPKDL